MRDLGIWLIAWVDFPPVSLFSQEKSILPTNHHRQIHSSTLTCCQSHTCSHTFRLGNSLHMLGLEINRPRYVGQYLVGWGEGEHTTWKDGIIWKSEKSREKKSQSKEVSETCFIWWFTSRNLNNSSHKSCITRVKMGIYLLQRWTVCSTWEIMRIHEKTWICGFSYSVVMLFRFPRLTLSLFQYSK